MPVPLILKYKAADVVICWIGGRHKRLGLLLKTKVCIVCGSEGKLVNWFVAHLNVARFGGTFGRVLSWLFEIFNTVNVLGNSGKVVKRLLVPFKPINVDGNSGRVVSKLLEHINSRKPLGKTGI